jgi:hypothetical protein
VFRDCVEELKMMMEYVRGLKFDETPKYDTLIKLVKVAGRRCGVKLDTNFDWIKPTHEFEGVKEGYLKRALTVTDFNDKDIKYAFIISEVESRLNEVQ